MRHRLLANHRNALAKAAALQPRQPRLLTLVDGVVLPEDHDADVVVLQVERHALDAAVEAHQLAGLHAAQAVDARDAVSDGQHAPQVDHRRLVALRRQLGGERATCGDASARQGRRRSMQLHAKSHPSVHMLTHSRRSAATGAPSPTP